MSLEVATNISQLNPANPSGTDLIANGDEHIRLLKAVLRNTFPNITGPMPLSQAELAGLAARTVPVGLIADWYGTAPTVPPGWAICNGQTVPRSDGSGNITTPNLQDRVTAGASSAHEPGTTRGQTLRTVTSEAGGGHSHVAIIAAGGAHTHTLSGGSIASATSRVTVTSQTDTVDDGGSASNILRGPLTVTDPGHTHTYTEPTAAAAGGHTHVATLEAAPAHAHAITNIDVTQPTYALHKIMKI